MVQKRKRITWRCNLKSLKKTLPTNSSDINVFRWDNFKQFLRLRNQLIVAADNFTKEEILPYINVVGLSRDIDEQLKHVHKVIEIAEVTKRKVCVTLLRYEEDNPETSYAQIRLFTRRTEEENFQQLVYVNYKTDEFIFLLDVMNSVCDQVLDNKPLCNIV